MFTFLIMTILAIILIVILFCILSAGGPFIIATFIALIVYVVIGLFLLGRK